ncbi:MAG: hypothetical protein QW594_02240 [Candidatus Woesearchaeota archaeon]
MAKLKKRLTQAEEFEIMKLVLDKFLWIGTFIIVYGFYNLVTQSFNTVGISFLVAGIIVFILFIVLLVREYDIVR